MTNKYDVVGIGNAIVDILSNVEDGFLKRNDVQKGAMTLIDADSAENIYNQMKDVKSCSGGSVANSMAALAQLGLGVGFMGRVKDDKAGNSFVRGMNDSGVDFTNSPMQSGNPTAICYVCITPDAERTMCTYIGACAEFDEYDLNHEMIKSSEILYIEGYLWDMEPAKNAIRKAVSIAKENGSRVVLSLSDSFCVERHKQDFIDLIDSSVDILFANEFETMALTGEDNFKAAARIISDKVEIAALTRGEKGVLVISGGNVQEIPAEKIDNVVDTTGAGDLFAAGFLYGLSKGLSLEESAAAGHRLAGKIIQRVGARADFSESLLAS